MALNLPNKYPGRFNAPSAGYPQGSFKNRTAPGALDGSYLEKDWANDKEGFFQSLIAAAGIVPNELVDKVGASQYFDALQQVIADGLVVPDASETVKGIIELATSAEAQAGSDTVRAVTPAGLLAALNALTLGRGQTWQDVTASRTAGVTYTNTTGRPIFVSVTTKAIPVGDVQDVYLVVGGIILSRFFANTDTLGENWASVSAPIPAGATYSVVINSTVAGAVTINTWAELR